MNAKYIQIYRQPLSYPSIEFSFKVTQFQKLYVRSIGRFPWMESSTERSAANSPRLSKGGNGNRLRDESRELFGGESRGTGTAEIRRAFHDRLPIFTHVYPRRSAANGRPADTSAGTPGQIRFRFNFLYEYRFCAKRRVAVSTYLFRKPWN